MLPAHFKAPHEPLIRLRLLFHRHEQPPSLVGKGDQGFRGSPFGQAAQSGIGSEARTSGALRRLVLHPRTHCSREITTLVREVQGDGSGWVGCEHHRVLRVQTLTSAFVSFGAVRAFPAYSAEAPRKFPGTGLKVPEKSPGCPRIGGGFQGAWPALPQIASCPFALPATARYQRQTRQGTTPLGCGKVSRPTHYETMSDRVAWCLVVLSCDVLAGQSTHNRLTRATP
jgi:hypothetical protein